MKGTSAEATDFGDTDGRRKDTVQKHTEKPQPVILDRSQEHRTPNQTQAQVPLGKPKLWKKGALELPRPVEGLETDGEDYSCQANMIWAGEGTECLSEDSEDVHDDYRIPYDHGSEDRYLPDSEDKLAREEK